MYNDKCCACHIIVFKFIAAIDMVNCFYYSRHKERSKYTGLDEYKNEF